MADDREIEEKFWKALKGETFSATPALTDSSILASAAKFESPENAR
jgi:hypothetical protein